MYITITNDNTIKSTPSRGFPDKDAGEKRQKQGKRTPRPVNITPEVTCNPLPPPPPHSLHFVKECPNSDRRNH